MHPSSEVAFTSLIVVIISSTSFAPCLARKVRQTTSSANLDFVNILLDEFDARKLAGRDEQRQYFGNEFEHIVDDIRQLVNTIDGDIQQLVDNVEQKFDRMWGEVFALNQQRFEETLTESESIQDAIESKITPADRKDPLVQTAVSDLRGSAQRLHMEMTHLCLLRQESFDGDLELLLKAAKRLHGQAAPGDQSADQSEFVTLFENMYDLLRENFGDYFDRNAQIFVGFGARYRSLAELVVSIDYL